MPDNSRQDSASHTTGRGARWHYVYYLLAAFDVLTVVCLALAVGYMGSML